MSQKKHKKRHPQAKRRVSAPVEESEFASDGTRKRMNGTTRNILLFALILLAATEAMFRAGLLPEAVSNVVAIVGLGPPDDRPVVPVRGSLRRQPDILRADQS